MSEAAIGIAQSQGFSVWIASPAIVRGWAKSRRGSGNDDGREDGDEVRAGIEAIVDAGMEMRRPYYLALAAECLVWVSEFSEARLVLEEALAIVDKTGERWSEGELLRLRGEIEARDDFAAAEASFQAAFQIARRQAAKPWELRSATSLARLWQGRADMMTRRTS